MVPTNPQHRVLVYSTRMQQAHISCLTGENLPALHEPSAVQSSTSLGDDKPRTVADMVDMSTDCLTSTSLGDAAGQARAAFAARARSGGSGDTGRSLSKRHAEQVSNCASDCACVVHV